MNQAHRLSVLVASLIASLSFAVAGAAPGSVRTPVFEPKAPAVVAEPLPYDLMHATIHRLSNGLTVYLAPNHDKPRIAAWIVVRSGSRHDPSDCTGLAHYLEHMLFKGSTKLGTLNWAREKPLQAQLVKLYAERFTTTDTGRRERLYAAIDGENVKAMKYEVPNELDKLYNQLGFTGVNAFTMDDGTAYICDFPRNRLDAWARVESDRFSNPVFRLFTTELETVYEEKNMSIDSPETGLYEAFSLALFPRHPYGTQPTLGTIEHLKNPSLQRVYDQFRSRYVPANMAIVMAGDFEPAALLKVLEKSFGGWRPEPVPAPQEYPIPPPSGVKRVEVTFEAEERVLIGWLTVPGGHPDETALTVMDWLMANSSAGIIDLSLVQEQKVKSAYSWASFQHDAGTWGMSAVPKTGQTLEQAEALLMGCVDKLKNGEFTEDDVKAVVTNWEVGEKLALESDDARVNRMAMSFVAGVEWAYTAGRLERARAVTKADVVRVARRYLGPDRVVAYRRSGKPTLPSIPKPTFTQVEIDPSRASAFFKSVVAMPAKPIDPRWVVEGKDYAVGDRAFGRLYSGPNPQNDVFSIQFGWTFGTADEKEIGAAFDLLDKAGADDLDAAAYRRRLFSLGSSVGLNVADRWVVVWVQGLEKNLEETFRLVFRRLVSPRVAPGTLAKMVDVAIGAHRDNKKNPDYVFGALTGFAERGDKSPVLRELSDTEFRALDQERLIALAKSVLDYRGTVRYVGTRSVEEIAKAIDAVLPVPSRPARRSAAISYLDEAKPRVLFVHREMVQSQIRVFAPDGILDPARFPDYEFFGGYMGGSMSSVIFQEIREARGLAYYAWGGYAAGHWAGDGNRVLGDMTTQCDKTIEASVLLEKLLHQAPMSAERFAEAKRSIVEGYRTNPLHFRDVPHAVMRWEEQGLPSGDPRPGWFARAQKYPMADLAAFSRRFAGVPFTLAILGNRDRTDLAKLKELGELQEIAIDKLFPY